MFLGEAITTYLTQAKDAEGQTYNSRVDENHRVHFNYKGNDYTFVPDFDKMTFKLHFVKDAMRFDENELLSYVNKTCRRMYYGKMVLDGDALDIVFEQDLAPCFGLDECLEVEKIVQSQSGQNAFFGFVVSAIDALSQAKDVIQEDFEKKFGKIKKE